MTDIEIIFSKCFHPSPSGADIGDGSIFTASYQQEATKKLGSVFSSVASGLLFCKSQSGSACLDAQGSRTETRAARRARTFRAKRCVEGTASPTFIVSRVYPEEILPPTAASIARCWTKLEQFFLCVVCVFSTRTKHNVTMPRQ